jgi:hypothetical protein
VCGVFLSLLFVVSFLLFIFSPLLLSPLFAMHGFQRQVLQNEYWEFLLTGFSYNSGAGPFAGSIVATVLYLIINAIEKALANPEQDWSRSDMQRTSHLSLRREAATAARWRVDPVGRIESSHDYGHGFRSGDADGDGRWRWMSGRRDVEEMI